MANSCQLHALIIATEVTKGMKSIGSKSLLKLKNSTLVIEQQIIELQEHHPDIKITVATGFEAEKMVKALDKYKINFLYNKDYEITNQAKSIVDFLKIETPEKLLIISSGVLFKETFVTNSIESSIFLLDKPKPEFTIGCNDAADSSYLFYDLPNKWTECVIINNNDLKTIKNISDSRNLDQLYLFEIINMLVDCGCILKKVPIKKKYIMKISNIKDLIKARSFIE